MVKRHIRKTQSNGCVVIGSGPSLNRIDVSLLKDFDTIAFNRSFIAWDSWGFHPTYYARLDPIGVTNTIQETKTLIETSRVTHFFLNAIAQEHGIDPSEKISMITVRPDEGFCYKNNECHDLGNVGASSLQILVALGYRRVVLTGIDAHYEPPASAKAKAYDMNHFHPQYSQNSNSMTYYPLNKASGQWTLIALECKKIGMDIKLVSPGSKLNCFEIAELDEALQWMKVEC